MIPWILGRKIGMTQIFRDDGRVVPVTVIEAGPCVVTQVKTDDRDVMQRCTTGVRRGQTAHKPGPGT